MESKAREMAHKPDGLGSNPKTHHGRRGPALLSYKYHIQIIINEVKMKVQKGRASHLTFTFAPSGTQTGLCMDTGTHSWAVMPTNEKAWLAAIGQSLSPRRAVSCQATKGLCSHTSAYLGLHGFENAALGHRNRPRFRTQEVPQTPEN